MSNLLAFLFLSLLFPRFFASVARAFFFLLIISSLCSELGITYTEAPMSAVASQKGLSDLLPCNDQCGGDYPSYSFGQTDKEVTVTVPVPPGTRAKSVKVEIKVKRLRVEVPSKGVVLDGELFKLINVDESTWCMQDGKELVITLTKTNMQYEEWWPHVVLGEQQIDMKTLKPPSMHFSELDDGAQATVAKMMHEQRQKMAEDHFNPA